MLGLLIGLCAILGLAVGSFLNVVIYRVPRSESIVVASVVLPGRAARRFASGTTSRSSPGSCSAVGVVTARRRSRRATRWWSWPVPHSSPGRRLASATSGICPAYLVLFAGLLALSCIDVERMILPKKIVYPLTVLVAALLLLAAAADGQLARLRRRRRLRRRLVRRVLRAEPRQSPDPGLRRRAAVPGPRPVARVARRRLRPAGVLRGQPHRCRRRASS